MVSGLHTSTILVIEYIYLFNHYLYTYLFQEEGDIPCVCCDAFVTGIRGRVRHQHRNFNTGGHSLELRLYM